MTATPRAADPIACHSPCPTTVDPVETPTTLLQLDGRKVFVKHEYMNPSGSTKDRIARAMLKWAMQNGALQPGGHVVEASSGSTALALAMYCARMGLHFTAIMPQGVSQERIALLKGYGSAVVLTDPAHGVAGSIAAAQAHVDEHNAYWPKQFENAVNEQAHRLETAPQLLSQMPKPPTAIVSGVGTGGTLLGLHLGCQDAKCKARPILARPVKASGKPSKSVCFGDAECTGLTPAPAPGTGPSATDANNAPPTGCHSSSIPGVVENMSCLFQPARLPGLMTIDVLDERALEMTRRLVKLGLPVGPSSGLNVCAAMDVLDQLGSHHTVATVLPDRVERYLSTGLFA